MVTLPLTPGEQNWNTDIESWLTTQHNADGTHNIPPVSLGTGTTDNTTFLRGDLTWQPFQGITPYVVNATTNGMGAGLAIMDPAATPASSLAALITAASPGGTVNIPDGIYRESVTVDKTLTLQPLNAGKVSIRGSDLWPDSFWMKPSDYATTSVWISAPSIPALSTDPYGDSFVTTNAEQVFYDGLPLRRVADNSVPQSGQFALDTFRRVLLVDRPIGHVVEVSTRKYCLQASGTLGQHTVTLSGLDIRHAASDGLGPVAAVRANADGGTGTGQILVMTGCTVMHNHGDGMGGAWAPGSSITGCIIAENGCFGANFNQDAWNGLVPNGTPVVFSNNTLRHNNTLGYNVGFGAGGIKITMTDNCTCNGNAVYGNNGAGLWFDVSNTRITCQSNVVSYNEFTGIMFEISGARNNQSGTILYTGTPSDISNNICFENGWSQFQPFNGGSGVFISTSMNVNVHNNTIAWCWSPIYVYWDTTRGVNNIPIGSGANHPASIKVYSNKLIDEGVTVNTINPDSQMIKFGDQQANHIGGAAGLYWNGGHNGGYLNQMWNAVGDGIKADEYQYDGNISNISTLNAVGTGGNSGGNLDSLGASTLISASTGFPVPAPVSAILIAAGIPLAPAAGHGKN